MAAGLIWSCLHALGPWELQLQVRPPAIEVPSSYTLCLSTEWFTSRHIYAETVLPYRHIYFICAFLLNNYTVNRYDKHHQTVSPEDTAGNVCCCCLLICLNTTLGKSSSTESGFGRAWHALSRLSWLILWLWGAHGECVGGGQSCHICFHIWCYSGGSSLSSS